MPEPSKKIDYIMMAELVGMFKFGKRYDLIKVGKKLKLCREPKNIDDPNAIIVRPLGSKLHQFFTTTTTSNNINLGYIDRRNAGFLAPEMDGGAKVTAIVVRRERDDSIHPKYPIRVYLKIRVTKGETQKTTSQSPRIVSPPKPPITVCTSEKANIHEKEEDSYEEDMVAEVKEREKEESSYTEVMTAEVKERELELVESSTEVEQEFDVSCPNCDEILSVSSILMGSDVFLICPTCNENFTLDKNHSNKGFFWEILGGILSFCVIIIYVLSEYYNILNINLPCFVYVLLLLVGSAIFHREEFKR